MALVVSVIFFLFLTFRWFYLYLAGCLALFEVFVLVASLFPSAVILASWSCIDMKQHPLRMIKLDRNMSG
jgi:hypothetical protein